MAASRCVRRRGLNPRSWVEPAGVREMPSQACRAIVNEVPVVERPGELGPTSAGGKGGGVERAPVHMYEGHGSEMSVEMSGEGQPSQALGAMAARSSEGRWPRIYERLGATGAQRARCVRVL